MISNAVKRRLALLLTIIMIPFNCTIMAAEGTIVPTKLRAGRKITANGTYQICNETGNTIIIASTAKDVVITQTSGTKKVDIKSDSGANLNLTLAGVDIKGSVDISNRSNGKIIIKDNNKIQTNGAPGIVAGSANDLYIEGYTGKATAASLTVIATGNVAAIGSTYQRGGKQITIKGCTINADASASLGAGIGGSKEASIEGITIIDSIVNAKGGPGSAGIGAGDSRPLNGTILISGNQTVVNAIGGDNAAGIGGSNNSGHVKSILIQDGAVVSAQGGKNAAGIGGSNGGGAGYIEIYKATVEHALGGAGGAGIGQGSYGQLSVRPIDIKEKKTTADDFIVTGIGRNIDYSILDDVIVINNSQLGKIYGGGVDEYGQEISGVLGGAGIGGGKDRAPAILILGKETEIKDIVGGPSCAGIGGAKLSNNTLDFAMKDGRIVSVRGGSQAAGIGGGLNGSFNTFIMEEGYIEYAKGGAGAAGIGSGYLTGSIPKNPVDIVNGTVYVEPGEGATEAIGMGHSEQHLNRHEDDYGNITGDVVELNATTDAFIVYTGTIPGFVRPTDGYGEMDVKFKLYKTLPAGGTWSDSSPLFTEAVAEALLTTNKDTDKTTIGTPSENKIYSFRMKQLVPVSGGFEERVRSHKRNEIRDSLGRIVFDKSEGAIPDDEGIVKTLVNIPRITGPADIEKLVDILDGYWFEYVEVPTGDLYISQIAPGSGKTKAEYVSAFDIVFGTKEELNPEGGIDTVTDYSVLKDITVPMVFEKVDPIVPSVTLKDADINNSKIVPYATSNLSFYAEVESTDAEKIRYFNSFKVEFDFDSPTGQKADFIMADPANIGVEVRKEGIYDEVLSRQIKDSIVCSGPTMNKFSLVYPGGMLGTPEEIAKYTVSLYFKTNHFDKTNPSQELDDYVNYYVDSVEEIVDYKVASNANIKCQVPYNSLPNMESHEGYTSIYMDRDINVTGHDIKMANKALNQVQ